MPFPVNASVVADVARKVLKIEAPKHPLPPPDLARDEDAAFGYYTEAEPTVREWLRSLVPSTQGTIRYLRSLLQCSQWLPRYNLAWLLGDSIAGLTVGFVVIPQAMAYALLATLSPEYGLYTSFVGAALYWLFGTSKDIVIGTTAVGSLLVGSVIASVEEQRPGIYSREEIAKTLSAVAGMILLFIGLFRLGWIIEFVPYIPISAFVTAASITIMATQFPVVMGIPGVNTREAPYKVIINSLKGLPRTHVDAAIGLSSIVLLYVIRDVCARMEVRQPARKKMWAIISSTRLTFAMLLYTFISWLINRNNPQGQSPFRIVGVIQRGFTHAGPPSMDGELVKLVLPELPAILIILVIEHIAIAKSFGRIFNYTVIPSQEILAQGASNLFGTFVGGYVCTGSFGASAVLSKAGVRTPLAGLFSAVILVLALYALTAVFYYIPMAALAGLIIHAVANLITPPHALYRYWQLSPPELLIWVLGVVVALFASLEVSIYVTIAVSLVLLLVRLARSNGRFLGQVRVHRVRGTSPVPKESEQEDVASTSAATCKSADNTPTTAGSATPVAEEGSSRTIFLPLDRQDASNPLVAVEAPYPGVFIYRFSGGLNYVNQAHLIARLVSYVKAHSRPAPPRGDGEGGIRPSDRLWSDYGPDDSEPDHSSASTAATATATTSPATPTTTATATAVGETEKAPPPRQQPEEQQLPRVRAIVLDCTTDNNIDITSVQGLVDARNALDRYACGCGGACVEWHFAGLSNRWARRALAVAGFGVPAGPPKTAGPAERPGAPTREGEENPLAGWEPIYVVATSLAGATAEDVKKARARKRYARSTEEEGRSQEGSAEKRREMATVHGVDRPFFHVDLTEAVDAAVRDARRMEEREKMNMGCR